MRIICNKLWEEQIPVKQKSDSTAYTTMKVLPFSQIQHTVSVPSGLPHSITGPIRVRSVMVLQWHFNGIGGNMATHDRVLNSMPR